MSNWIITISACIEYCTTGIILFTIAILVNIAQLIGLFVSIYKYKLGLEWEEALLRVLAESVLVVIGRQIRVRYRTVANAQKVFAAIKNHIMLSNHVSYLDWVVIYKLMYQFNMHGSLKFAAKKIVKSVPGIGWACWFGRFLLLAKRWDVDEANIAFMCREYVDSGTMGYPAKLLLFPEGTFVDTPVPAVCGVGGDYVLPFKNKGYKACQKYLKCTEVPFLTISYGAPYKTNLALNDPDRRVPNFVDVFRGGVSADVCLDVFTPAAGEESKEDPTDIALTRIHSWMTDVLKGTIGGVDYIQCAEQNFHTVLRTYVMFMVTAGILFFFKSVALGIFTLVIGGIIINAVFV